MSTDDFQKFEHVLQAGGAEQALEGLLQTLWERKQFHQWFDAMLLRKKFSLQLPVSRPTSLDDVPAGVRDAVEEVYISSARTAGEAYLAEQDIPNAWIYLRTIREPEKVARAIEALPAPQVTEEILNIAFFHGVAPVHAISLLINAHGMCSTITAFDQQAGQFSPQVRRDCAAALVRALYANLQEVLQSEVQRKHPLAAGGQSLRELIAGRDWLFADDNYHVDVSHLNSVVRFARSLDRENSEVDLARQLAEYGTRLAPKYQYPGNSPFGDFYPAHLQFFNVISGEGAEAALAYFQSQFNDDPSDSQNQVVAYTLVDLLIRIGRAPQAAELAAQYLADSAEEFGLSLPELCARGRRFDLLRQLALQKGDLVTFAGAVLQEQMPADSPAQ